MSRSVHPGPVHVSGVEAACGLLWGAWTGDPQGRLPYSKHTGAGRWDAGLHPSAPPAPDERPCCSARGAERLHAASIRRAQCREHARSPAPGTPADALLQGSPPNPSPTPTP